MSTTMVLNATTAMTTGFLDLPVEIIAQILCNLDLKDILNCQRTHSLLYACLRDHQLLQYHIAKQIAAVEDNPHRQDPPVSERLDLLNRRERGWERLRIDFQESVKVDYQPSGIYDLAGGVYLLGNINKTMLHYCVLPKKATDKTTWNVIDVQRRLIDVGLAIQEHDLIAVVTTMPSQCQGLLILEIQLLEFSTGKAHPLAKVPTIFVSEMPWGLGFPTVGIEIVGENLALVSTYTMSPFPYDDSLRIYDWKTGDQKMEITVPFHTYAGITFISPSILLLPNMRNDTLDIWSIPEKQTDRWPLRPIRTLALPELTPAHYISCLSCRCEPNPIIEPSTTARMPAKTHLKNDDDSPYSTSRSTQRKSSHCFRTPEPFRARWQDAIVILNIRIQTIDSPVTATFSLFMHRSALLALVPSVPDPPPPLPPAGATPVHGPVPRAESSGADEMEEGDDEDSSDDESWLDDSPVVTGGGGLRVASSGYWPKRIPWQEWGPPISRCFDTEDLPTRWITTSAGQRAVIYSQNSGLLRDDVEEDDVPVGPSIMVLDFNKVNVRRMAAVLEKEAESGKENGDGHWEGRFVEVVDHATGLECDMFESPILSTLPYVSISVTGCPLYEGVLMDEERLLGLRTDKEENICAIDVIHLGG